ncbi:MAG: phosphatidate cytidylyltransferase [Clostridia bacterium]|nr:phosphatidate cytidylyltransferase [Clostridia bacterium]MBR3593489.1 phosphatidate cytidylyltransferase [Clostridia bacterium]
MKTRIISGVVGGLIFAAILIVSTPIVLESYYPWILKAAISLLAAIGTWEILNNTKIVKNKIISVLSSVFAAGAVVLFSSKYSDKGILAYFIFVAVLLTISLFIHEKTSPTELAAAQAYTLFIAFSFSTVVRLLYGYGVFAFILVFIFAWASDTFAYFTGVFLGKHKLCPALSPKKTIEGAVGGVVGCMIAVAAACLINDIPLSDPALWTLTLCTPIFSIMGMVGDISASYIKRHAGIKDYGNLMPGHGGVLDRFDSVLLIAPVFYSLLCFFPTIMI